MVFNANYITFVDVALVISIGLLDDVCHLKQQYVLALIFVLHIFHHISALQALNLY